MVMWTEVGSGLLALSLSSFAKCKWMKPSRPSKGDTIHLSRSIADCPMQRGIRLFFEGRWISKWNGNVLLNGFMTLKFLMCNHCRMLKSRSSWDSRMVARRCPLGRLVCHHDTGLSGLKKESEADRVRL